MGGDVIRARIASGWRGDQLCQRVGERPFAKRGEIREHGIDLRFVQPMGALMRLSFEHSLIFEKHGNRHQRDQRSHLDKAQNRVGRALSRWER